MIRIAFVFAFVLSLLCHAHETAIHGFVSQGFLKSKRYDFLIASQSGTYQLNESAINLATDINDYLRMGLQLMSRDYGDAGNNNVYLDWGFVDYNKNDDFGIRLGKVKMPMGLYNQGRDIDMLRTFVFLPNHIYTEEYRAYITAIQGGGIYGNSLLRNCGDLEYEAYFGVSNGADSQTVKEMGSIYQDMFNAAIIAGGGAGGVLVTDPEIDVKKQSALSFRWNTRIDGLRFGYSDYQINADINFNSNVGSILNRVRFIGGKVISAEFVRDKWLFCYEQSRTRTWLEFVSAMMNFTQHFMEDAKCYMITHRFSEHFEAGTYFSTFHDKTDAIKNKDKALCFRYDFDENWCLKLEYHRLKGGIGILDTPHSESWNSYVLKTTISF